MKSEFGIVVILLFVATIQFLSRMAWELLRGRGRKHPPSRLRSRGTREHLF